MNDKKVKYWINISEDDLETAEILFSKDKYLHAGYFLQQSIEKLLKAYYQLIKNDLPPRTHNLVYLAEITGIINELKNEQENILYTLNPMNIETRYPEYREKISKSLTKIKMKEILDNTKELHRWIKEKF
ncbi:MAG: HEPN domain-containing protein [Stygiobacter sp.]|nr:MAG: HEPN domain-containing protein [Stygiobacter sp.]